MEDRSLHVQVHREDGMFWTEIAEWPGCLASGETLDELMEAVEESIALYVTPEDQPVASIELWIRGIEVRVGSERPLKPAREQASAGPLTPRRINSPHRDWGFGRFDRRPGD